MKKWILLKIAIWLFAGLTLCYAITAMLSSHGNLGQFYNNGQVYHPVLYNPSAVHNTIKTDAYKADWKYLYFYVSGDIPEQTELTISYFNKDKVLATQIVPLREGGTRIKTDVRKFTRVDLFIADWSGTDFYWDKVEFRENAYYSLMPRFIYYFISLFILYFILSAIFIFILRKRGRPIGFNFIPTIAVMLQKIWLIIVTPLGEWMALIPEKIKSMVRILCFSTILLSSILNTSFGNYLMHSRHKWYILLQVTLFLLMALFNLKKDMRVFSEISYLERIWIVFCIGLCISDFIVDKKFMFVGYWQLGVLGLLFWTWRNAQDKKTMLKEFIISFQLIFLFYAACCFLFKPYDLNTVAVRAYTGLSKNPNTLGEFISIAVVTILAATDELLYLKKITSKILCLAGELLLCLFFIYFCDSRASYVVLLTALLVFFIKNLWNCKNKLYLKNCLLFWGTVILLLLPGFKLFSFGLQQAQGLVAHAMQKQDDQTMEAVQYELEDMDLIRTANKADLLLLQRVSIYKQYLSKLNLWGHFGDEVVRGQKIGSHNLFLTMSYRYGVVVGFIYLLFIMGCLLMGTAYLYKNRTKMNSYALLPIGVTLAFAMSAFWGNLEQPLRYIPWICFYYSSGFYMVKDDNA